MNKQLEELKECNWRLAELKSCIAHDLQECLPHGAILNIAKAVGRPYADVKYCIKTGKYNGLEDAINASLRYNYDHKRASIVRYFDTADDAQKRMVQELVEQFDMPEEAARQWLKAVPRARFTVINADMVDFLYSVFCDD